MLIFITQMPQWLIKNLTLLALFLGILSFNAPIYAANLAKLQKGRLATANGELIQVSLAVTDQQQTQGLSGLTKGTLKANQGMLFVYENVGIRNFWMPDTYFNLDIFFLDKDLKIIYVARDMPHHPGRKEPPLIARTKSIFCSHILELASSSKLAKSLKLGQSLKWIEKRSLYEIKSSTHP